MKRCFCLLWALGSGLWMIGAVAAEETWHYDAKGRCDPFFPLVQEGKSVPCETNQAGSELSTGLLQLGGILWDAGGNSIALINGTEVKRGDRVEGYDVAEIRNDAVVLMRDGQSLILQMTYEDQKEPASTPSRGAPRGGKHP